MTNPPPRTRCRYCQTPIVWITTEARGRPMPCDPLPRAVALVRLEEATAEEMRQAGHRTALITAEGVMLHGYVLPRIRPGASVVTGYVSHFATCPKADYYRRYRRTHPGRKDSPA